MEQFNPYHKWLGISRTETTPKPHQLLGVECNEDDPEVIRASAVRQSTYVRHFQSGRHAQIAAHVLEEIEQAKLSLLGSRARNLQHTPFDKADGVSEKGRGETRSVQTTSRLVLIGLSILLVILAREISRNQVIFAALIPPVGVWLIWQHPTWGIKSKIRWTGLSVTVFLAVIMANHMRTAFLAATEVGLNAKEWVVDQVNMAAGLQNAVPDPKPARQGGPPAPAQPPREWAVDEVNVAAGLPNAVSDPAPASQGGPTAPVHPPVGSQNNASYGRRFVENGEEMEMATWSPDGKKIATASKEKIRIWGSETLELQNEITRPPNEGFPECVFTANDGSRLITASDNGVLQLWDVPSQRVLETTRLSKLILGMSRSALDDTVLVRHPQNSFEVRRTSDLQQMYAFFSIPAQLKWWTPIGSFVKPNLHAVISDMSELIIIDSKEMRIVKRVPPRSSLKAHTIGLAVSRDGRRLAVGTDNGGVFVYDTTSWNQVCYCDQKTLVALCVAFSSDGRLIISGNVDGALRVWDADSGKQLKEHRPGTGQISSISVSPDGREIAFTEIRGGQKLFVWSTATLLD